MTDFDFDFDFEGMFGEDYLELHADALEERADAETDLAWRLLDLRPGLEALDLARGHGRIANRLAARDATRLRAASRWRTWRATCGRCPGRGGSTGCSTGSPRTATSTTTATGRCWPRYGEDAEPLTMASRRMITVAER